MKTDKFSETADGAAAVRAAHRLFDKPIVFNDPYAERFLGPRMKWVHTNFLPHRLIMRTFLKALKPIEGQVLCRARFAEDSLVEAISQGVDQYVIIGAGFDSFGLRRHDLMNKIVLFELDHPNTQHAKREGLADVATTERDNWHFLPIDFETQELGGVLNESQLDRDKPIFFSWLGTVPYLSREATIGTLETLTDFAASTSELVFDYLVPNELLSSKEQKAVEFLMKLANKRGEPLISFFEPGKIVELVERLGLKVIENLSPEEQNQRYFSARRDNFVTAPNSWFMRIALP